MYTITGTMLRAAFTAAAHALHENKDMLDAMNVFPVPDGDTGINMYLTSLSAAEEVGKAKGDSVATVAKAASAGALRGARGNSGVILSQLFRGFARGLEGVAEAGPHDIARALTQASETAYKAIMKPKEGTILTVAREVAEKAAALTESDHAPDIGINELFTEVILHGNDILLKTKEMLPSLKAANVEDAGGKGFLIILNAMYCAITGETVHLHAPGGDDGVFRRAVLDHIHISVENLEDIVFGYCTEFFITTENENNENELKEFLGSIGDSVVVVEDGNLIKIHVHTNDPGMVLQKALTYGELDNVKIDNMRAQAKAMLEEQAAARETEIAPKEDEQLKDTGFVAVANGQGFTKFFKSLGADHVIPGGQSMNPSAEDFIRAIGAVPAKSVIVLPNNKNIILAARQAADMCTAKDVYVVPSRSMPQGLAALTGYNHTMNVADNAALMENAIQAIDTGLLTRAVRDTIVDGMNIYKGDAIGIVDGKITLVHRNASEALRRLTKELIARREDVSFLTVYYGEGVKPRDAEKLMMFIAKEYPELECELQHGGQPVYRYILSAE